MNTPPIKISVITATWNCVSTINDCLDSVAAQSYTHREHVLIDGASNDGTFAALQARQAQLAVLVSEKDRGIYDALNKGIARASGDVVGFLHADDVYASADVLDKIAHAFADPAVVAVYGDLQYVRKHDVNVVVRYWRSRAFTPSLMARGWMPAHPTLYVRRSAYASIGGFDTRYRIAADYFSILQLFKQQNFRAVYIPAVLVKMRLGGASNRSIKNIIAKSREDFDALRRSGFGVISACWALAWKNLSKITQFVQR